MSNVVSLKPNSIHTGERIPDSDVIAELEELLAKAKDGEIIGINCAATFYDQLASPRWAGFANWVTVGALQANAQQLAVRLMQDDDEA